MSKLLKINLISFIDKPDPPKKVIKYCKYCLRQPKTIQGSGVFLGVKFFKIKYTIN